jgi:hypothetical protein
VVAQLVEKVVTFVVDGSAESETVDEHAAFSRELGEPGTHIKCGRVAAP